MYKNLKFSWAHILAFLAIICIAYVSFVGAKYYKQDTSFTEASVITGCIIVILIVWFIGAQQLKGIDNRLRFDKWIWLERFLYFTAPLVFVCCLYFFNHALNVADRSSVIEESFVETINSSKKMFTDYQTYASKRIDNYDTLLNNARIYPNNYRVLIDKLGTGESLDTTYIKLEKQIMVNQLLTHTDSLQKEAFSWIDKVNIKTSVWNVFLLGNIDEIQKAVSIWDSTLVSFSSKILTTETTLSDVQPFSYNINSVLDNLDNIKKQYSKENDSINLVAIILAVILYLSLMLPYYVQERNGVSTYTLWGRRNYNQKAITLSESNKKGSNSNNPYKPITLSSNNKH